MRQAKVSTVKRRFLRRASRGEYHEGRPEGIARYSDLRHYLPAAQRTALETLAIEPACCRLAGHGADGNLRRGYPRAGLSLGGLRYAGVAAGNDDHLHVPLPG